MNNKTCGYCTHYYPDIAWSDWCGECGMTGVEIDADDEACEYFEPDLDAD